jgi:hypothetical protein
MRVKLFAALVLGLFAVFVVVPVLAHPAGPKQITCHYRLMQGDPLGSLDKGTLKVLAEPTLVTIDGQNCSVEVNGYQVNCLPLIYPEGKIHLDFDVTRTQTIKQTKERTTVQNVEVKTSRTVRPGKVAKVRLGKTPAGDPVWLEVSAEIVKP